MDIFTKEKRSEVMKRIRSKNTSIEVAVFRELRKRGIYFQKHYKKKGLGSMDIALPRKKKAVFLDGDFWHGYRFSAVRERLPESYWLPKIENNIKRDRRIRGNLRKMGWQVLRVWEHDIKKKKNFPRTMEKIVKFLTE